MKKHTNEELIALAQERSQRDRAAKGFCHKVLDLLAKRIKEQEQELAAIRRDVEARMSKLRAAAERWNKDNGGR